MMTPAKMNEELTGAFWKKGATTDAVKIILPVSVRMSAARFFCFSVNSNRNYPIALTLVCQFLSRHRMEFISEPFYGIRIGVSVRVAGNLT